MFGNSRFLQRNSRPLPYVLLLYKAGSLAPLQPQPPIWVSSWTPLPPTIIIMADKGFLLTNIIVVSKAVSIVVLMQDELLHLKHHLPRCPGVTLRPTQVDNVVLLLRVITVGGETCQIVRSHEISSRPLPSRWPQSRTCTQGHGLHGRGLRG